MPPRRVDEFDVYEFHVIIAEEKGTYTAVGRDAAKQEVARVISTDIESVTVDIRTRLTRLSEDFVGIEGAVNQFLRAFPQGFDDPFFIHDERNYKLRAHEKAKSLLGREVIERDLQAGRYSAIVDSARKVFTNLIFPNEGMAFKSFTSIEGNSKSFAPLLYELLYGSNFDAAFDAMADLLVRGGAAKWTIMTYWPFILYPNRHMFMKPEVAQVSSYRLGDSFGYESKPSSIIYANYLGYVSRLKRGIEFLKPRDNIDVQTFMYAVGKPGFVREGVERREQWMRKREAVGLG